MDIIDQFKYCPNCGKAEPDTSDKSARRISCKNCRLDFFLAPSACVGVYLLKKPDEVLLVKRKIDPFAGTWDMPGGFIENGETGEQACTREIQEELSVKIKNIKYVQSSSDRYEFKGLNYFTLGYIYTAEIESGNIVAADDALEAKYFKLSEIPWDEIGFNSVKESLKKLVADYEKA